MKIRGHRECRDCGHRWSYYETGEVACPDCGSMLSRGVDDRTRHTDSVATLDLDRHRSTFGEVPIEEFADDLKGTLREYRRRRGFVSGGRLLELDDTYLAAAELRHAIDVYARRRDPTTDEELYVLDLLRGADAGERPGPDDVPASMAAARGLGDAESVDDYRTDAVVYLDDNPDPEARRLFGQLREQVKRVEALQGDVSPVEAESLVAATRDLWRGISEGDETALATAADRLAGR